MIVKRRALGQMATLATPLSASAGGGMAVVTSVPSVSLQQGPALPIGTAGNQLTLTQTSTPTGGCCPTCDCTPAQNAPATPTVMTPKLPAKSNLLLYGAGAVLLAAILMK
jgi:hypothetical protein